VRTMPTIMCARCKTQVQRAEWSFNLEKHAFEIRVECHNARETCYLPRDWEWTGDVIAEAWAFKDALPAPALKQLEAP
jgi:hypothetical protein